MNRAWERLNSKIMCYYFDFLDGGFHCFVIDLRVKDIDFKWFIQHLNIFVKFNIILNQGNKMLTCCSVPSRVLAFPLFFRCCPFLTVLRDWVMLTVL